ncbi:hypothetical protein C9374_014029 [Naegleria lovaniensis]|uniref:Auxin efflux carrier n=1 Tax=Naegleria lovaniensis TaxID=51637 RepID=A0AA88KPS6_NAELO|nr:uncharacterized protein C9374_014029 [Naegleria lovaniensis]KAG2389469.1 hypothetical protein C9374_014029 [Naegleria lovaniensis]
MDGIVVPVLHNDSSPAAEALYRNTLMMLMHAAGGSSQQFYNTPSLLASNQTSNSTHSDTNVTILLFMTSLSATIEVVIACSIGAVLVFVGVLTPERVQFMSKLIFTVFSPTFNLHALSRAISIEALSHLWMLPIINLIQTILGNIIGRIVFFRKFWRGTLSYEQQQVQHVTQTFNNGVTLPLVFMSAICKISAGGVLFDIDVDKAVEQAIAYINVYTLPSIFLFWSYGLTALSPPKKEEDEISLSPSKDMSEHAEMIKHHEDNESVGTTELQHYDHTHHEFEDSTLSMELKEHKSIENEHHTEVRQHNEESNHLDNGSVHEESGVFHDLESPSITNQQRSSVFAKWTAFYNNDRMKRARFILKQTINAPVIALFLGTIIGLIEPVKTFLITDPPMIVSAFVHTLTLFSSAIFPISMLILGANVATTLRASLKSSVDENESSLPLSKRLKKFLNILYLLKWFRKKFINFNNPLALAISIVLKLAVMPLCGVGVVYLGTVVWKIFPPDPILVLTILVEFSVPMAMATTTLSSINGDFGQSIICENLLFNYLLAPLSMSLYCWWFLNLCCQFTGCL